MQQKNYSLYTHHSLFVFLLRKHYFNYFIFRISNEWVLLYSCIVNEHRCFRHRTFDYCHKRTITMRTRIDRRFPGSTIDYICLQRVLCIATLSSKNLWKFIMQVISSKLCHMKCLKRKYSLNLIESTVWNRLKRFIQIV